MPETVASGRGIHRGAQQSWCFCHEILPDVSRTFALTIPVLPKTLTDGVCCAYLLCRIADTIEDHSRLTDAERRQRYQTFLHLMDAPHDTAVLRSFTEGWPEHGVAPTYQRLVRGTGHVMAAFMTLPPAQSTPIHACVVEMVTGMEAMNERPPQEGIIYVARDLAELERYCHYVAGTVGLMLTQLFNTALPPDAPFGSATRLEQGRRFGLGLQLTNILKDQAVDVERGTSFLPRAWLESEKHPPRLLPTKKRDLILRTLDHLDQAEAYTLALPPSAVGMRLFCLWAFWMAAASVREVARSKAHVPKISRLEVAKITAFTQKYATDDGVLRTRYDELRREAKQAAERLCC